MKYKVIITLLMVLFVGSVGNAQSFRDNNNMLLGKVESDALSETRITCDWAQSVQMELYAATIICVLALSALTAPYATITI